MDDLVELSPDRFEHREWVALQWVRRYLLFEGSDPDPELAGEFEKLFSPRERTSIFAVFKLMLFFNMLMNTIAGAKVPAGDACAINPAAPPPPDSPPATASRKHED